MNMWRAVGKWLMIAHSVLVAETAYSSCGEVHAFSVPSQLLEHSLNDLSDQTEVLVLFPYGIVKQRTSSSLDGSYTVCQAVDLMLRNTGLVGSFSKKGVLMIATEQSLEERNKTDRKNNMISKKKVLSAVIGLMVGAGTAPYLYAQGEADQASDDSLIEEIEVTASYSKSLEQAIEMKRMETGFSDSIVATDVADFPEQNLVEALQRMPGISMERNRGIGTGVTVRSLPSEYTHVSFNNMSTSSGSGGRGANLDIFASDIIQSVTVKKSPMASEEEGGIAGSIQLRTARPFDFPEDKLIVSADSAYNSISEKVDPKISFLGSKKIGNWGALFSYSEGVRSNRTDSVNGDLRPIHRWTEKGGNDYKEWQSAQAMAVLERDAGVTINDPDNRDETSLIAFAKNSASRLYAVDQEKWGATASIQYKPSDDFSLTFDGMLGGYVDDELSYNAHNYTSASNSTLEQIHAYDDTTMSQYGMVIITDATFALTQHEILTEQKKNDTEFNQFSMTLDWEIDGWTIDGLIGYSGAEKTRDEMSIKYEADQRSRTRYTSNSSETIVAAPSADDPTPWDPYALESVEQYHMLEYKEKLFAWEDDKYTAQLDFQKDLEFDFLPALSSVQFGVRYTDKTSSGNEGEVKVQGPSEGDNSWKNNRLLTTSEVESTSSLADGGDFSASGNPGWYAIPVNGIRDEYRYDGFGIDFREDKFYEVQEKTLAAYAMVDFAFDIGDMPVYLNTGVRFMDNKLDSAGFHQVQFDDGSTDWSSEPISTTGDSNDVLPSMNLTIDLTDDLVFRAAASETLMRPALGDLAYKRSTDFTNYKYSDGNPGLESTKADQWEVGLEWYPENGGLVALSYFDKRINGAVENQLTGMVTGVEVLNSDGTSNGEHDFEVYQKVNVDGFYDVNGIEVNVQLPFDGLHEYLAGFGINANYTYLDTSLETESDLPQIPNNPRGLAENTYNATVYYENNTFDVRVSYNYKDEYLSGISYDTYPIYRAPYDQFDLAMGYMITDGIKASLKVINLTDEVTEGYNLNPAFPSLYEYSGRRISLGVRGEF